MPSREVAKPPSRTPFRATAVGVVVLLAAVIALAILVSPLAGGVLLAIGMVLLIVHVAMRPEGQLRDAAQAPHPHGGAQHVIVVADTELAGDRVAEAIRETAGDGAQLDVVAPVLVSHLHYAMSDRDAELAAARRRLDASLAWAREHGFRARGTVGSDEPETAMADALRDFGAEAIVVVTDGAGKSGWAEDRELDRARAELAIPVVHVRV